MRVRENAESIAFYNGDQREAELAGARLARVIAAIFGKVRGGWEVGSGRTVEAAAGRLGRKAGHVVCL